MKFPATALEREISNDPRLSIEERYSSKEDYLGKVRDASESLVRERYMLEEDVPILEQEAGQFYDYLHTNVHNAQP